MNKLSIEELEEFKDYQHLIPGNPYLWVLKFGWAYVGYYVKHIDPVTILIAHASFFTAAQTYDKIVEEGLSKEKSQYYGTVTINTFDLISPVIYYGAVYHGD